LGPSIDERISDKLRTWLPILLHHRLLWANKNLTEGLWQVELWHLCGLCRALREFLRAALDLQPCLCTEGGDQRQRSCIDHCQLFDMLWLTTALCCARWSYLAHNNGRGMPIWAPARLFWLRHLVLLGRICQWAMACCEL
jgi:hypothetical protein